MAKGKKKRPKGHDDIYESWAEFSKEMGDRLNKAAKEQVNEYKDLYNLWSEYTQKMTEHMSAFSPDDSKDFDGMQQIWAEYSGKLGKMLMDISSNDNGTYKQLQDLWDRYSGTMTERMSDFMAENLRNQKELYELWMDSFGIKEGDVKQGENAPYDVINSFFKKMWEHSMSSFPPNTSQDKDLQKWSKECQELWMKAYSKSVMDVVKSPAFADINGHTLEANLDVKQAADKYMNWYLSSIGVPTQQNIDEIYHKLHELDRKMSGIVRILNEINSTKKK